jgi:tRNA (cytidine/uridine-2'-O-)-methyltransferase
MIKLSTVHDAAWDPSVVLDENKDQSKPGQPSEPGQSRDQSEPGQPSKPGFESPGSQANELFLNRMLGVALYQPEIAGNAGTLVRLSACWGSILHLIHPLGFVWSDRHLRRSGLDYHEAAQVEHHQDIGTFTQQMSDCGNRCVAVVPNYGTAYWDFKFALGDVLLMGSEQRGLPQSVIQGCAASVHIPMRTGSRSLNLAVAASMVLAEACRQQVRSA